MKSGIVVWCPQGRERLPLAGRVVLAGLSDDDIAWSGDSEVTPPKELLGNSSLNLMLCCGNPPFNEAAIVEEAWAILPGEANYWNADTIEALRSWNVHFVLTDILPQEASSCLDKVLWTFIKSRYIWIPLGDALECEEIRLPSTKPIRMGVVHSGDEGVLLDYYKFASELMPEQFSIEFVDASLENFNKMEFPIGKDWHIAVSISDSPPLALATRNAAINRKIPFMDAACTLSEMRNIMDEPVVRGNSEPKLRNLVGAFSCNGRLPTLIQKTDLGANVIQQLMRGDSERLSDRKSLREEVAERLSKKAVASDIEADCNSASVMFYGVMDGYVHGWRRDLALKLCEKLDTDIGSEGIGRVLKISLGQSFEGGVNVWNLLPLECRVTTLWQVLRSWMPDLESSQLSREDLSVRNWKELGSEVFENNLDRMGTRVVAAYGELYLGDPARGFELMLANEVEGSNNSLQAAYCLFAWTRGHEDFARDLWRTASRSEPNDSAGEVFPYAVGQALFDGDRRGISRIERIEKTDSDFFLLSNPATTRCFMRGVAHASIGELDIANNWKQRALREDPAAEFRSSCFERLEART